MCLFLASTTPKHLATLHNPNLIHETIRPPYKLPADLHRVPLPNQHGTPIIPPNSPSEP